MGVVLFQLKWRGTYYNPIEIPVAYDGARAGYDPPRGALYKLL
jgi:hypothetical protein